MYLYPIKSERAEPRAERALRVCHIIGHLRFGGAERQVVNLARHMTRAKSYIVCLGQPEGGGLSGLLPADVEVVWMGLRARYAPYHIGKLARRLRDIAPDVVHTHMFWPNVYGVLAATLGRGTRHRDLRARQEPMEDALALLYRTPHRVAPRA